MFKILSNKAYDELFSSNTYLMAKVSTLRQASKIKDKEIKRLEKTIEQLQANKTKYIVGYQPQRRPPHDPSRNFQEANIVDDTLVVNTNGTYFGEVLVKIKEKHHDLTTQYEETL